jgi:uncharacterized phiE125 gp8 family phage protein
MELSLVSGTNNEIVSLEETKNYLRIDHDFDDSLLKMLITSTREAMESITQKSITVRIWKYVVTANCIIDTVENSNFPVIRNGVIKIPLPKPPVTKIMKVSSAGKEIDRENYLLETLNSRFLLYFFCKKALSGKRKFPVEIIYEAGISAKEENIPYQLKLANLMLISNAYQERYSYNQNSVVSQGVKKLLAPFLDLRIF